jgi:hypothetical protein
VRNVFVAALLLVAAATGCASNESYDQREATLERYSDDRFASETECERAMLRVDDIRQGSALVPADRKPVADRVTHDRLLRDSIRKCTITLSQRDAACLADARSSLDVQSCRTVY